MPNNAQASTFIEATVAQFPAHTHALTLVHDPDRVLVDEEILAALIERGFTLVDETDPIRLRYRIQALRPFRPTRPVIIVTEQPLNQLPYDLWQQGHPVKLALHTFFPNYVYSLVQSLSVQQRWQLSQIPPPARKLGRQGTREAILAGVFQVEPAVYRQPPALIAWLNRYHALPEPMPPPFLRHMQQQLQAQGHYAGWPLAALLTDPAAFSRFLDEQWRGYVQKQSGQPLAESGRSYLLPFDEEEQLQDALPRLVRSGHLNPVSVAQPEQLPEWMQTGLLAPDEERPLRRFSHLLAQLAEQATPPEALDQVRWAMWQSIAYTWAELTALYHHPDLAGRLQDQPDGVTYRWWQRQLDVQFRTWLERYYAPLAGQKLPTPHHLYHVLTSLDHRRSQPNSPARVALIILDGMSLADWVRLKPVWQARQPHWQMSEQLLLAQIPTITAISRQALVSGLRPADFDATLSHNRAEKNHWQTFWEQAGLSRAACAYLRFSTEQPGPPPEIHSSRLQALCLIVNAIDQMVHQAGLGQVDMQASLKLWLDRHSQALEAVIETLRQRDFAVYLTSDHGHVEATGVGYPSEGLLVETRSKRARLYRDRRVAEAIQQGYEGLIWGQDGLLPDGVWALMPTERTAFASNNQTVVTHGGVSLDEIVVPLVHFR